VPGPKVDGYHRSTPREWAGPDRVPPYNRRGEVAKAFVPPCRPGWAGLGGVV